MVGCLSAKTWHRSLKVRHSLTALLRCKSINIFIINLAVSNVLQLVVVAPIVTIDNLTEFFELGDIGCKSKFYLQTLFFIVPMLTISVISIDRQTCMRCLTTFGRVRAILYLSRHYCKHTAITAPTGSEKLTTQTEYIPALYRC